MSQDASNTTHDKTNSGELTGNISSTRGYAIMTPIVECFTIKQGVMKVPTYNGKNLSIRDFIHDVSNGEFGELEICER